MDRVQSNDPDGAMGANQNNETPRTSNKLGFRNYGTLKRNFTERERETERLS